MIDIIKLHNAINEVCPIVTVRIEDPDDRTTWSFDPEPRATDYEIEAARALLLTWTESAKNGGLIVSA